MYEAFGIKVQQNAFDILDLLKQEWLGDFKPTDEVIWRDVIIPQWQYYWQSTPQAGNVSGRITIFPWYNSTLLKQQIANATDRKIALTYLWELPTMVGDLDAGSPIYLHLRRGFGAMQYHIQQMPRLYQEVMSKYPNGTIGPWNEDPREFYYGWLGDRGGWGLFETQGQFLGLNKTMIEKIRNWNTTWLEFNEAAKKGSGIDKYLNESWKYWDLIKFIYGYNIQYFGKDSACYDWLYLPTAMKAFGVAHSNRGVW
ncbi:MAG: hypothetical protein N3F10_07880, partial [Candidatus Bathyarchaeota archaeon]|nr:hypothetical protein [Candidatus Bathyarchaeota archaeon]